VPCPDEALLRQFALGVLKQTEMLSEVARHVQVCAGCHRLMERMTDEGETIHERQQLTRPGGAGSGVPASLDDLAEGTMLDHFRVMRLVGMGGMGRVYLARDTRLGRKVALKVLQPGGIGSQPAIDSLLNEARTTASFNHPNIVTIHHVGQVGGMVYLALEYLEGHTLRQRLREARIGFQAAVRIGHAVAQALAVAHASNVLHRDLKPENVFIPHDGRPRVLDFGLALARGATQDDSSRMGTPHYMAPEQWRLEPVTPATDVWAMGLMLHELFIGQRPHLARSAHELEQLVCSPEPVVLGPHPELPDEVLQLVRRCLDKDPAGRPAVDEIVAVLGDRLARDRRASHAEVQSPFVGLESFDERQAELFFGREAEIARFVERIRREPVMPVVGPSGSGKSSFVQAGVIPRLREQGPWVVVRVCPGTDPFGNLAQRLQALQSVRLSGSATLRERPISIGQSVPPALRQLSEQPRRLSMMLRDLARQTDGGVLLFVDQLEELYTLVPDEQTRQAFMQAICTAADDRQDPVRVIFTLRDDFLGRVAEAPVAREALSRVTVLRSPDRELLEEILQRPVQLVGHRFEEGLVRRMVDEVNGESASLPMLQFAARMLWDERDRSRRLLLQQVHDRMGGVTGALASHADSVLGGLSPAQLQLARQILLRLVTSEFTRRVVRRTALLAGLSGGDEVLSRLTRARLITARRSSLPRDRPPGPDDEIDAELELAHESLIQRWRTLARWLEGGQEERLFLEEVGDAARVWSRRGCREGDLWSGETLKDALRQLARCTCAVPDEVRRFLEAARARQRRRRRMQALGVAAGVVLLVALVAMWIGMLSRNERAAQSARRRAEGLLADARLERARSARTRGDVLEARSWLREALELRDTREARRQWVQLQQAPLLWSMEFGKRISDLAVAPDGRTAAASVAHGPVVLLDLEQLSTRRVGSGKEWVSALGFSPDGRRLAVVAGEGRAVSIRDLRGRVVRQTGFVASKLSELVFGERGLFLQHSDGVVRPDRPGLQRWKDAVLLRLGATKQGLRVAMIERDALVVRDLDGRTIRRVHLPSIPMLYPVVFRPDGRQLAVGQPRTSRVLLVDLDREGTPRWIRLGHPASHVSYSADGRWLALADTTTGKVRIWDDVQRDWVQTIDTGGRPIRVAFTALGLLLTVDIGGRISVWRTGWRHAVVQRPHRAIGHVAFSPDGKLLVSTDDTGHVTFWNQRTGQVEHAIGAHQRAVSALAFAVDGRRLATGGADGMIRLWNMDTGAALASTASGHDGRVQGLAFDPGDRFLLSAGVEGKVRFWDPRRLQVLRTLDAGCCIGGLGINPSGTLLAVSCSRKDLRVYALPSGKRLRDLPSQSSGSGQMRFVTDRLVAVSGIPYLELFDAVAGTVVGQVQERAQPIGPVVADEGRRIALRGPAHSACILCSLEVLDDGRSRAVVSQRREVITSAAFDPSGTQIATGGGMGTVRLWHLPDGRPRWRAPLMTANPPRLYDHRGVLDLARGRLTTRGLARWEKAVLAGGQLARTRGEVLCLARHDGQLELWNRTRDRRTLSIKTGALETLLALPGGCAFVDGSGTWLVDHEGRKVRLAPGRVSANSWGPGRIQPTYGAAPPLWLHHRLVTIQGERMVVHDLQGRKVRQQPVLAGTEVLAADDRGVLGGTREGEVYRVVDATRRRWHHLEPASEAAVLQIAPGPSGMVAASFVDGTVAVWDGGSGELLLKGELAGPVIHLLWDTRSGGVLYAATDQGHYRLLYLESYGRPWCELLREVWRDVPYRQTKKQLVWSSPPDHPCRGR